MAKKKATTSTRLPDVIIQAVPHHTQKYDTCGDWRSGQAYGMPVEYIRVSKLDNPDYEFLVALHELIEWYLCRRAGVSQAKVDAFDLKFEAERRAGKHGPDAEPGDDARAPYHWMHQVASLYEQRMAAVLGVDWKKYEAAIETLPEHPSAKEA